MYNAQLKSSAASFHLLAKRADNTLPTSSPWRLDTSLIL